MGWAQMPEIRGGESDLDARTSSLAPPRDQARHLLPEPRTWRIAGTRSSLILSLEMTA
jgi:hypothetical protein